MKKYIVLIAAIYLTTVGLLFSMAPDVLSLLILGVMTLVLLFGFLAGIVQMISFTGGFRQCRKRIEESLDIQTTETWLAVFKIDNIFGQKQLDEAFRDYKNAVEQQKDSNELLSDIVEFINEEFLAVRTWRGITLQIPGTLTGLGILGTFIGLIIGIGSVGFSTVDAALESISSLLSGIEMAFYTSIAGVILSILFNILNHIIWNIMIREYELFVDTYHRLVIPSTEEQTKRKMNLYLDEIVNRLDRIPKRTGFTLARSGENPLGADNDEEVLMQQVIRGLFNEEFLFYLQPAVDLRNGKVVRAEALVRWNHEVLGMLTPSVFLPALEKNGYITKLDSYIWNKVCRTIREWIDQDLRPVPISINISHMDIFAMDTVEVLGNILDKYNIPPRFLELEIDQRVFEKNTQTIVQVAGELRRKGFKVIMDGFDGDFISINMLRGMEVDELKLDLQCQPEKDPEFIDEIFDQSRKLGIEMSAAEIENAEQVANLTRVNCYVGQGEYFYSPMPIDAFKDIMELV